MGKIVQLQNKKTGENEYPRTYTKAIIDDQATPLDTLMQNQNDKIAELGSFRGYFTGPSKPTIIYNGIYEYKIVMPTDNNLRIYSQEGILDEFAVNGEEYTINSIRSLVYSMDTKTLSVIRTDNKKTSDIVLFESLGMSSPRGIIAEYYLPKYDVENKLTELQIIAYISGGNKPKFKFGANKIHVTLPFGNSMILFDKKKNRKYTIGITKENNEYEIDVFHALVMDVTEGIFKVVNMTDNLVETNNVYVLLFNKTGHVCDGLLLNYYQEYSDRWSQWTIQDAMSSSYDNIIVKEGSIVFKKGFSLINGTGRYTIYGSGEYTISTLDDLNGERVVRTFVYIDTSLFANSIDVNLDETAFEDVFVVADRVSTNPNYILFAIFYYQTVSGGLVDSLSLNMKRRLDKDILDLKSSTNLSLYFSGSVEPVFKELSDGSLEVKMPIGNNSLRIYDKTFNILKSIKVNGESYNVTNFQCLVFNKDTNSLEVIKFTGDIVVENYIVLLLRNTIGAYSGIMAPYYYKFKDKQGIFDNISIQDAMSNETGTINVEKGVITINKGFSLFMGGKRYPIGTTNPYHIKTLDDLEGARVTRTYVYIDISVLDTSANYLDGDLAKNIFVITKDVKNNRSYILFATFYYQEASGGLIDVYRNKVNDDVVSLYKSKENERNQCRFRSDFNCLLFSDIHASESNMSRIVELANNWGSEYVDVVLNGGDTASNLLTDGYEWYNNQVDKSSVDILAAAGNHDEWIGNNWNWASSLDTYNAIIAPIVSKVEGVVQPSNAASEGKLYYYKDYGKVRVVVLEPTRHDSTVPYWDSEQSLWMKNILEDARVNSLSVICLCHTPFEKEDGVIDESITFNSWLGYKKDLVDDKSTIRFDSLCVIDEALTNVDEFIDKGGKFVCWIAGHTHLDYFVKSKKHERQVMFVTASARYDRAKDTQPSSDESNVLYDCMSYIGVDLDKMWLKILRIGRNIDGFMREKNVLVWDLNNQKVIANY